MNIKACYDSLQGDYEGTKNRLISDNLIEKLLLKYLDDKNMEDLSLGINEKDCEKAFKAVHTMKGTALNLGFNKLADSASRLTELLRVGNLAESFDLYLEVKNDYELVIKAINENI